MVTKRRVLFRLRARSSVLAKILMVTKRYKRLYKKENSSVLAKILMVTKPQKYGSTFLNVIKY